MKELIHRMIQALVDHPDQVEVMEIQSQHVTVYEVRVAKADMGQVIGKQGRTAIAIRHLLNAASGKVRKRVILEILE